MSHLFNPYSMDPRIGMDQIMAMVKTVGSVPSASQQQPQLTSFEPEPREVKQEESTMLSQVFPHLSTSSESTSEDHVSFDYPESEPGEARAQLRLYAGDPREKKLQEKIEFVKIVHKHKSSLFGDCDGHESFQITPRSKEDAWKRVAAEVESAKLESYRGKPWARLRDHDWQYVRRHALSRNENTTRPCGKLGELDKIVLDVITTTSLANAVTQATNSLVSQGSTNSHTSQQSSDSVDLWRTLLNSVNQESTETTEMTSSFDFKEEIVLPKSEDIVVNTTLQVPVATVPQTASTNILDYLQKVTHVSPSLSVDAAIQSALTRSPTTRKMITSRSATAPSVYAITSSTASPPQLASTTSVQPPLIKRARIESEKSPGSSSSSVTTTFEQKKEALMLRKLEVDIRHTELLNEKLELEIRAMENQEKRSSELHAIEVRAAKAKMLRGAAIDEPSIDANSQRVLVRQPNGYNLE